MSVIGPNHETSRMPQNEETTMDENDLEALKEAKKCQDHGESLATSLKDPLRHQPYLESLLKSLSKRESILGRYNRVTAQSYAAIGNVYRQMEEPRAVVMYRTCFRIETFLYGQCHGPVSGIFKGILLNRGLTQDDIDEVRNEVMRSMTYEMEGDFLRRLGDKKAAVLQYQKAAKVEEFAFGRDNPDLAYLWRKMACLASLKKGILTPVVDFDEADRMGNKWMKQQAKEILSPSVCSSIRRGDRYYESLLYSHAVGEYVKATTIDGIETRKSKYSSSKHKDLVGGGGHRQRTPHSPKKARPFMDLTKELHMLLSGELAVNLSDDDEKAQKQKTEEPAKAERSREHRHIEESSLVGAKIDIRESSKSHALALEDTKTAITLPESDMESEQEGATYGNQNPPLLPAVGGTDHDPPFMSKLDVIIRKLQEERKVHETARGKVLQPSEYRSKPERDPIPSSDSSMSESSSTPTNPQTNDTPKGDSNLVVSTSKFRKAPRESSSHSSSLRAAMSTYAADQKKPKYAADQKKPKYAADPKKPKSESYLSKMAYKTTKMASRTTKMAKTKLKKARSSLENRPKSTSSIFGSQRSSRTTAVGSEEEEYSKAKSTPYLRMELPPITPHRFRKYDNVLRETVDAESIASLRLLDAQEDYSIANSAWLPAAQDAPEAPNPPESTGVLGGFLASGGSKEESVLTTQRGDEKSILTSDESIKERYLKETAQMIIKVEDKGNTEPSLVELDHHEEEEDVKSSSSELLHKSGSTVGHNDSAQGSFLDESRLSIVFEDHSTPSDQPKPRVDVDI